MTHRLKKILCNPRQIPAYLAYRLRKLQVRRIVVDGKIWYKYQGTLYPDTLNHGNARSHVEPLALKYCKGSGIDIGADRWPLPGATPVYNEPRQNAYCLDAFADASLDYVFSSHCLEHLVRWQDALKLWIAKLKPGGILFLYLPHHSMKLWAPGGPWAGLHHVWQPRYEILREFLEQNGLEILAGEAGKDEYWSFHLIAQRPMHAHA